VGGQRPGTGSHLRYRKLLALLGAAEAEAVCGTEAFHTAVERFASRSAGTWLKVAGGSKAKLLEAAASAAPLRCSSIYLEIGSFIGYSAMRLHEIAGQASRRGGQKVGSDSAPCVVSIEGDPVHTALARHFIDLTRAVSLVEVLPGAVRDVVPLVGEDVGSCSLGFAFMDQKGTTFHMDHGLLDRSQLWIPHACIVSDNIVRPGAPVYAWAVSRVSSMLMPTFWSMPEFLEETDGVEDWMAVVHLDE